MDDTRHLLLAAAARRVATHGVASLTLAAVAVDAGVSKGGLLYHFPNKRALIAALLAFRLDAFEAALDEAWSRLPERPGRFLRAYVAASVAVGAEDAAISAGLLAATVEDPSLLDPLRARYGAWQARLDADGLDPDVALVARLALDGLWACDVFGLPVPEGRRDGVVRHLAHLAGETP